jgi:hypothetical protein
VPPVEGGIERRFPGRIVGDFVVDENVDHDFGGTPFQREKVLQTPEKCKGSDHRGLDLRAGCDPLDGRGRVNGRPQKSATTALLTFWSVSGNAWPSSERPVAFAQQDAHIGHRWIIKYAIDGNSQVQPPSPPTYFL